LVVRVHHSPPVLSIDYSDFYDLKTSWLSNRYRIIIKTPYDFAATVHCY
jgi:hypothetical protein